MTEERITSLLANYRTNQARLIHLRREAQELRLSIQKEQQNAIGHAAIRAQQYSGMPHSGAINRSVEENAIRHADGYLSPLLRDWTRELAAMEDEIATLENAVGYVDGWLSVLDAREQIVITSHSPIGLMSWREMAADSKRLLGEYMSQSGLRKIGRAAERKIYSIAK